MSFFGAYVTRHFQSHVSSRIALLATAAYAGGEVSTWTCSDDRTTKNVHIKAANFSSRFHSNQFARCDAFNSKPSPSSSTSSPSFQVEDKPLLPPYNRHQLQLMRRRMTNVGRFSLLSETRHNPSVPVMILAMTGTPFTPQDFVSLYRDRSIATKHPRFGAHLDASRTHFEFNNQKTRNHPRADDDVVPPVREVLYPMILRAELKDRINDAIQEMLPLDETLWEARTATGGYIGQSGAIEPHRVAELVNEQRQQDQKAEYVVESLLLFRAHHCMADGVSLGALFGDFMDEGADFQALIANKVLEFKQRRKRTPWWKRLLFFWYYWCWGSLKAIAYHLSLHWQSWREAHRNPWTLLREAYQKEEGLNPGDDEWEPRTISWRQVTTVQEVKQVADYFSKQTKGKITINDIFCSCISAAVVKLIRYHKSVHPTLGDQLSLPAMNLVIPVHMNGGILLPGESMGNKIGAMVAMIPGEQGLGAIKRSGTAGVEGRGTTAPQDRLIQVHKILMERKQTPAAVLSYLFANVMGSWGSSEGSIAPWLFEKAHANASVVVTNVKGPEELVHLDGRQVEAFLGFLPLPPGIPIGMVVGSYNRQLSLTVTAEPWAVPDADRFLSWVVEEYRTLLEQARVQKDD